MKNKKHYSTEKKIYIWLHAQSLFLILGTMISFVIVEIFMNDFKLSLDIFINSLGVIVPMILFITVINYVFAKNFAREANDLATGLERASLGDYNAKLDPSRSTIFEQAYVNFNKLEEELKKANTLQDEFVNNYSHEFKTPINSIKGFAELILDEELSEEDKTRYLKIIVEESKKLTALSENSILMTKLNSQTIVPNKCEYLLDEQIRRCAILFEPEYTKKKIKLTCNLEEATFYGSEELMEHLWNNLISNAIKYTNKGGNISINLRNYSNSIIVSIIDDGVGISKEDLKNIFNKFYQVDKSKTTKGLGLGLTIVSRILQLVEGKIKVESIVGEGTNFTVTLKK